MINELVFIVLYELVYIWIWKDNFYVWIYIWITFDFFFFKLDKYDDM